MSNIIEIRHLYAAYGDKTVLEDISLEVEENDYLGIIGPNGGGKTTLVKIITGLKHKTSGTVTFFKDGRKTDRLSIGYLPQYNGVDRKFPISVEETVLSGLIGEKRITDRYSPEQKRKAKEIIEYMGLGGLENRPIGSLSGGQMQRVLLGRAIVSAPALLVLDEPDTYIDRHQENILYKLLKDINKTSAIIIVSHDMTSMQKETKHLAFINKRLSAYNTKDTDNDRIIQIFSHGEWK